MNAQIFFFQKCRKKKRGSFYCDFHDNITWQKRIGNLFLLSRVLLIFRLGSLLPLAQVAGISTRNTELPERGSGLLFPGDGALGEDVTARGVVDGEGSSNRPDLLGRGGNIGGGVTLLDLADLAGEEDQLGFVLGKAGDVGLEGLDRGVAAAVVDGDADGESELAGDLGLLRVGGGG